MSIQSLDSLGRPSPAKRPAVKDAPAKPAMPRETVGGGIAGGSSTFVRLQKGNQKRPLWMMAAPAAIIVAAAGALVYAATMSHPGANPALTAPVPATATDTPAAPAAAPAATVSPQPSAPAVAPRPEHRDVAVVRRTEQPEARVTHRAVVQPQAQPSPAYPTTAAPSTPSTPVNPPDTTPQPTLTAPPTPAPTPTITTPPTETPPVTTTPPN